MKNVLQLTGSFHQGGSERQAVQLSKLLNEDGEFKVFLASLNREGALLNEAENAGFKHIPEYKLTSFFDLNFLKQLSLCADYIRRNRIDIVHTHDFYTNLFGILAAHLAGAKAKISSKRETSGLRSKSQERMERFIFRASSAITVNSRAVKDFLAEKGIPSAKVRVVYNGIDLERLKGKGMPRGAQLREFGLPDREGLKYVALVANLRHDVKNHPLLLRAASKLKGNYPNARFVFAGEGPLLPGLQEMADNLGVGDIVHFLGRCEDVASLLEVSDAGVLTSFAEGFSNSILEYMAAGLPVVATDVGGASEAVAEGKTGFLIPSDNAQALVEKLSLILEDGPLAKRMGEKGRQRVEAEFSCRAQIENIKALYNQQF